MKKMQTSITTDDDDDDDNDGDDDDHDELLQNICMYMKVCDVKLIQEKCIGGTKAFVLFILFLFGGG